MHSKTSNQNFDLPWKYILGTYFQQFMELCWPTRAAEINWQKKPKFLDKELIKITKDASTGNKFIDKLIEVELISGNRCGILLHIEVQSTKQNDFSKRMFVYRYKLRDIYSQPIASLAILIDGDPNWRPNSYSEAIWDSEISMRFPIIKLIDYDERMQELEQSTNPFAIVILAQLIALKKHDNELKLSAKIRITKKLYTLGFSKESIFYLFKFIDWIITLPEAHEEQYMKAVSQQEEFKNFISPGEKILIKQATKQVLERGVKQGLERGVKQGLERGIISSAINMLKEKLPLKLISKVTGLSIKEIEKLKTIKSKKH